MDIKEIKKKNTGKGVYNQALFNAADSAMRSSISTDQAGKFFQDAINLTKVNFTANY